MGNMKVTVIRNVGGLFGTTSGKDWVNEMSVDSLEQPQEKTEWTEDERKNRDHPGQSSTKIDKDT